MGEVIMNGEKWVLVDTPLPKAPAWTNDIIDKVRESIRPYFGPDIEYAKSGGVNWKLIMAGAGLGLIAILILRKRG